MTAILTSSQYPWRSAHVLAPLLIGVALIAAFFVWEWVSSMISTIANNHPELAEICF